MYISGFRENRHRFKCRDATSDRLIILLWNMISRHFPQVMSLSVKKWIALCLVIVLVLPPALMAASPAAPPVEDTAGPRAYDPWWDFGFKFRRPVSISNPAAKTLDGYQLFMSIPCNPKMNADFSDLRFAQYNSSSAQNKELPYWIENKTDGVGATVWVKSDSIKDSGTSTMYMYYGNSTAATASNGDLTFEYFDDFESGNLKNGWTFWNPGANDGYSLTDRPGWLRIKVVGDSDSWETVNTAPFMYWTQPNPGTNFVVQAREDGAGVGATNRHSLLAYIISLNLGREAKGYWGAYMSTTSCKFEADGFRGTIGDPGAPVHYIRFRKADNTLYYDWSADWTNWTNTGSYNLPSAPGYWGVGGKSWGGGGSFNADFDYFFVRKYASPEPSWTMGDEELPFKFVSMSASPAKLNIGETVFCNATFNNPTPDPIKVQVAAREADGFNDTSEFFYQEQVTIAPLGDTVVPFTWTAVGGPHTIWLAVFGQPFASAKIKVNRDPVIAPLKDQSLWQDRDFIWQVNASDPDGDNLAWTIDNPLFNITPLSNRSAEIGWLPTNDDIGVHRANITVRDPMNQSDTRRVNFTVNNINDPPALAKIPSLAAAQYKELRYTAAATDPDTKWGDVLTYSDNTDLFDIDARTGEFFFTPVEEHIGKHNVKVTVTDAAGLNDACSFTITVSNVNDPPVLDAIPAQFGLQGKLFQLKVAASDPDLKSDSTEKLSFGDTSPLFNINADTGLISFTPTNDQIGAWICNITVTDRGGLANTTSLGLTVMNANDPPSMEAIGPQTATEEAPFTLQLNASDPDLRWGLDNLTFSDDTDLFNIDPRTGAISFTPTGAQAGFKRVTITVKDEKGATASASFDLTIAHVNHAPYDAAIKYPVDGARLNEGDPMYLEGTARDPDKGDTLQYSWFDNDAPAGTGRNISVKLLPGAHTIRLEVSDGTQTVTASSISVQVVKKNTVAPVTSSGGSSMLMLAAAAAAILAVVAVIAVLATRRRKQPQEPPGPSGTGRVDDVPGGVALPPVPPAEAAAGGEEAQRMIDSTVNRMAEYQEAHPETAVDFAAVTEKLNIARDMLRSGQGDDALDFAREADSEATAIMGPKAARKVVRKKAG